MKNIVVLERWQWSCFSLRLVSNGDDLSVQFKNNRCSDRFWRTDEGVVNCLVERFNDIFPVINDGEQTQ